MSISNRIYSIVSIGRSQLSGRFLRCVTSASASGYVQYYVVYRRIIHSFLFYIPMETLQLHRKSHVARCVIFPSLCLARFLVTVSLCLILFIPRLLFLSLTCHKSDLYSPRYVLENPRDILSTHVARVPRGQDTVLFDNSLHEKKIYIYIYNPTRA